MLWREQQDVAGGILAYDMGLGKTLISLALVLHDKFNKSAVWEETETADANPDGTQERVPWR
jgi:SNF2 family DNA or RNA helicase